MYEALHYLKFADMLGFFLLGVMFRILNSGLLISFTDLNLLKQFPLPFMSTIVRLPVMLVLVYFLAYCWNSGAEGITLHSKAMFFYGILFLELIPYQPKKKKKRKQGQKDDESKDDDGSVLVEGHRL